VGDVVGDPEAHTRRRKEDRRARQEGRQLNQPTTVWGSIEVRGARENNLKNISLDIPKRRLTVFSGVSGSGKSSLVFGTIAAESQRLINETYSAFVQGFMPTLARPDVDSLEGLTTAIILDQERMGANVRSTVGTVTDANALLRILFSRRGEPHIGGPQAFSFNIPSVRGGGAITIERGNGGGKVESRTFSVAGGMCPRCEGMGSVTDIDVTHLYDVQRIRLLRRGQADPRFHQDRAERLPPQGADQGKDQRHQPDL
jgi:excinuclease UvrABC ATPase subunit